jgi:hypothetical protein
VESVSVISGLGHRFRDERVLRCLALLDLGVEDLLRLLGHVLVATFIVARE